MHKYIVNMHQYTGTNKQWIYTNVQVLYVAEEGAANVYVCTNIMYVCVCVCVCKCTNTHTLSHTNTQYMFWTGRRTHCVTHASACAKKRTQNTGSGRGSEDSLMQSHARDSSSRIDFAAHTLACAYTRIHVHALLTFPPNNKKT
jgi:hypothetical protein